MRYLAQVPCLICQPARNHIGNRLDFIFRQFSPFWYPVPLRQTAPAAAPRCVLCDKHRMTAHWGLCPIVERMCRGQTISDDFLCLSSYRGQSPFRKIRSIRLGKMKTRPEFGTCQTRLQFVVTYHFTGAVPRLPLPFHPALRLPPHPHSAFSDKRRDSISSDRSSSTRLPSVPPANP